MNLLKVTPKTKIRHRNEINNTFSALPLSARRILFMAMAQIDSRQSFLRGKCLELLQRNMLLLLI